MVFGLSRACCVKRKSNRWVITLLNAPYFIIHPWQTVQKSIRDHRWKALSLLFRPRSSLRASVIIFVSLCQLF